MRLKSFVVLQLLLLMTDACGVFAQVAPPPEPVPNGPAPVIQQPPQIYFNGSVVNGQVSPTLLNLSLREAIRRGLLYNLGILNNHEVAESARAERARALSTLLPNFSIGATQTSQQVDLAAFGITAPGIPRIVGPFGYQNARAFLEQTVYDRTSRMNLKSATESRKAAELTAEDARNLVVQAVSSAYLAIISDMARVSAIQAELATAQALFNRATDEKNAGTVPAIDVLRANVELKTEQQRLVAQRNQVEKDKLSLARAIGLPAGQQFNVTDELPYSPISTSLDDLLKQAYDHRTDFRAAQASVRAAQYAIDAARAEHYWPSVVVDADYGVVGSTLVASHGTFDVLAGIRFPIYAGGRARIDTEQARAILRSRQNEMNDLHGRIDYEIRNALLDLQSAAEQVDVAKTNVDLANETLTQSRDRFAAGVTDNIEVIQAQQLLATANENYIGALNAHNQAKIALATALGTAEEGVPQFLNLK